CRRGDGGGASLHVDARRREAELGCGHERDARRLPRRRPHADGIPRADQASGRGLEGEDVVSRDGLRRRLRSRSTVTLPLRLRPGTKNTKLTKNTKKIKTNISLSSCVS